MDWYEYEELAYEMFDIPDGSRESLKESYHEIGYIIANNRDIEDQWASVAMGILAEHFEEKEF